MGGTGQSTYPASGSSSQGRTGRPQECCPRWNASTRQCRTKLLVRREKTLKRCLAQAEEQVERLAQERDHADLGVSRREQAARERAVREREERVEQALRQLPALQAVKERQKRKSGKKRAERVSVRDKFGLRCFGEARVSTTDQDARVMKMADGPTHRTPILISEGIPPCLQHSVRH